ncbi:MAG: GNAT family N-acetyltransferase [Sneathiellales bacterium]|nr:GNAT family N-acetyltransferase [Sneathiellales bacterium]
MILQSDRVQLVPLSNADLKDFHETNTNPFVRKYLWDDEVIPAATSAEILNDVQSKFEQERWGLWKILDLAEGHYLGYAGLWQFFGGRQPQLLYALLPENTGQGYATEASRAVIDYAFKILDFEDLIAAVDAPNTASVEVCRRLEMTLDEEKEIEGKPTFFFKLTRTA